MIANQQKLKTNEYGIYRMTKDSNGIERQVFNYNAMALEKFREIVQQPPTLSTEVNWI